MIFCLIFGVCATAATGHQNCLLRIDTFHAAPDIFSHWNWCWDSFHWMIMIMRHSLLHLIFVYWHFVFTEIDIVVLYIAIDNDIMRRSMLRTCYWFLGIVLHLSDWGFKLFLEKPMSNIREWVEWIGIIAECKCGYDHFSRGRSRS